MNAERMRIVFDKKLWCAVIAAGLFILGIVFALSKRADMRSCEQKLTAAIEFVKEQSAAYVKYNDTAIAKSLVRETTAVHTLENVPLDCDEAALRAFAKELWLTGISVLDAQGELLCEYTENGIGYAKLQNDIKREQLLSVIGYPQKTYVKRVYLEDGSFADAAVHSCAGGTGAVLAYRYTRTEFSQKSVLSIQTLLDGYETSSTGTLLLVEGNHVEASNDPELIGVNVLESDLLQSIRNCDQAEKLIRADAGKGLSRVYGMYSHGRDYYLYAYVPARQIYNVTISNLTITMVAYVLILALILALRWNSEKEFRIQQERAEQAYKKSLEHKNTDLELAIQHETAANRAKREFLFNMSHDIRTPMNAIIGFTSLAQTHIDDREQVSDYLKKISISSRHLLSLINDVLDMSRIENGKVTLEAKPVHLPELVHDLEDIVQPGVSQKHLSLSVDTAGMENEDVVADPMRLDQILINILANAVKFTPDGGRIRFQIVQKHTAPTGFADFEFRIKDTGIGMSEAFQSHIFEQFARENTSTVSKTQGTGLGMAITKSLVDMMLGTITVESKQGEGSEFIVSLRFPVSEARAEESTPAEKVSDLSGRRLLVVEDNALNLEIAVTILQEAGFAVDTAENGKLAVEKLRAAKAGRYDLILMDIQMPEMDGYEATRQIRALSDERKANIPIIAMTANAFEDDRRNALSAGMNGHIAKPLDIGKLMRVLAEILRQ